MGCVLVKGGVPATVPVGVGCVCGVFESSTKRAVRRKTKTVGVGEKKLT